MYWKLGAHEYIIVSLGMKHVNEAFRKARTIENGGYAREEAQLTGPIINIATTGRMIISIVSILYYHGS